MFPDNLHICDPTDGRLYIVENDVVTKRMYVTKEARSILVCQNMADIYTVNRDTNAITRIHKGEPMGDILVGNMPYGICEDINGKIYVTNYADQTVSVIQDGKVEGLPIPVSAGPRGIVADYYGNVWVACYLANTVVKITNHTVVDEIPVPYNPEGITCSPTNDIWVACSGSNVAVKINHSIKQLTVSTGKCPVAIVCDKKGNIFTANFEDDTVTMISSKDGYATAEISVGDGPSAIAINSQNLIYVTSNLSGEMVYKINPSTQQIIDRIHVCKSQCAFGDFTGCAAFNVFYPNGRDGMGSLIPSNAISNVIQSLKPTFDATVVDETDLGITIKVSSNLLNLDKFDTLTVNEIENDESGEFFIPSESIGSELVLRGTFNDDTNGASTINFVPIEIKNLFKAYFGIVDTNYNNYQEIKTKNVDFNSKDVVSTFLQQPTDGHLVLLVPHRVLDNFQISDGMMVQGDYNIGDNWQSKKSLEDAVPYSLEFDVDTTISAQENVFTFDDCYSFTVTSGNAVLIANVDYDVIEDIVGEETKYIIKLKGFTNITDDKITVNVQPYDDEQNEIALKLQRIYASLAEIGWSENRQNQYSVLVNNYMTNANERWMFNFFDISE